MFFDNLQVTHSRGALLEENSYYPFGLQMAGISGKSAGKLENKYKYNAGTELNSDFDINLYETAFRGYDPQIGRFHQIDPLASYYPDDNPYMFAFNNPIVFNDPNGAEGRNKVTSFINDLGEMSPYGASWNATDGITTYDSHAEALNSMNNFSWEWQGSSDGGLQGSFDGVSNSYDAINIAADFDPGDPPKKGFFSSAWGGVVGRAKGIGNAFAHPSTIIKSAVDPYNYLSSMANIVTFGALDLYSDVTTVKNEGLDGLGKVVGEKLFDAGAVMLTEGVIKGVKVPKGKVQAAEYAFTKSAGKHLTEVVTKGANKGQLARPYMNSPLTIQEIMSTGKGTIDGYFKGGMNWKVPGTFRGSQGTWELGINPKTNIIYHFLFK